jgi:2-oxoglutarate dehydrogenase E1 component
MSRQDANAAFAHTSFLYGGNADYIEDLYARYENDPKAVDAQWQAFFQSLKDDRTDVLKSAEGPSWSRPHWPQPARGELISALDGDWHEVGKGGRQQAEGARPGRRRRVLQRRGPSKPRGIRSTP